MGAVENRKRKTPVDYPVKPKTSKLLRGFGVILLGFLILSTVLPSIGAMIQGPARPGMWRVGPFLFFPVPFFAFTGAVLILTGCTLVSIVRAGKFEIAGWILLGCLFIFVFMG